MTPGTRQRGGSGRASTDPPFTAAPPLTADERATSQLRRLLIHRRPRSHRRKSRWRIVVPVLALLVLAGVTLAGGAARFPGPAYPPGPLGIATGDQGSVYYSYGWAVMQAVDRGMPGLRPYLITTDSSQRNMALVNRGETSLAFGSADTISSLSGADTAELATIARLYDDYLHLVVRRDAGISDIGDLVGKRVSVGVEGSSTARTVNRLLHAADVSEDETRIRHLGLEASAEALIRSQIDAFFFFGGVPTRRLKMLKPFKLIDLAEWVPELRKGYGAFYSQLHIPSSAYGSGMEPVTTVGVPTYLVVPRSMDPDLAYALTAMLFDQRNTMAKVHPVVDRLNRRAAINTLPLRLHPGAARYYQDMKI